MQSFASCVKIKEKDVCFLSNSLPEIPSKSELFTQGTAVQYNDAGACSCDKLSAKTIKTEPESLLCSSFDDNVMIKHETLSCKECPQDVDEVTNQVLDYYVY